MILATAEEEIDVLTGLYLAYMLWFNAIIILPLSAYEVFLRYPGSKLETTMALVVLTYKKVFRIADDVLVLTILPDFLLEGGSTVFLALALRCIRPVSHELIKHFICADRCRIDFITAKEPL